MAEGGSDRMEGDLGEATSDEERLFEDLLLSPHASELLDIGAEAEVPSSSSSDYEDFETASLVQSFQNDHDYLRYVEGPTKSDAAAGADSRLARFGEELGLRGHLGEAHHVHGRHHIARTRHNLFYGHVGGSSWPNRSGCPVDEGFPRMDPLRLHLPLLHQHGGHHNFHHHHHHYPAVHFAPILRNLQNHFAPDDGRAGNSGDLRRAADSLANYALTAISVNFSQLSRYLVILPPDLQFSVYRKLYLQGRLCQISYELCDLRIFKVILGVTHRRWELHQMFQSVMDHGLNLADILVSAFAHSTHRFTSTSSPSRPQELPDLRESIRFGFQLGIFLLEAGWYLYAEQCLQSCLSLSQLLHCQGCPLEADLRSLECSYRLLEAYNGYCLYYRAFAMLEQCENLIVRVEHAFANGLHLIENPEILGHLQLNLPDVYNQFSVLYFYVSKYTEALAHSKRALRLIRSDTPPKTVMEVCRQAAKVLTVRRHFKQADLLIKHAVSLGKYYFEGAKRFPDVLLDFGFYLTNIDMSEAAAKMHQMALDHRMAQFGGMNIRVAQAHEDLAYALYVQEYSSGQFTRAKDHSGKALTILSELVPDNHLLLSSCRRVKALILEEIAIDSQDKVIENQLLTEAEELHLSALTLCKRMFGEENIATAKHYGNLGRLYQSMKKFEEAESMHQRAIAIKKRLMGEEDYEVALSIGHLASLYNYDMDRFDEAEKLYLKSIEIGKRLLGEAYSGLEYDYRGLMHCYLGMENLHKLQEYTQKLNDWKLLRDMEIARQSPDTVWTSLGEPRDSAEVVDEFFKKFQ